MDDDNTQPTEDAAAEAPQNVIDIFNWANLVDGIKNDLEIELFVFNKNYTPYSLRHDGTLATQIRALFLYCLLYTSRCV